MPDPPGRTLPQNGSSRSAVHSPYSYRRCARRREKQAEGQSDCTSANTAVVVASRQIPRVLINSLLPQNGQDMIACLTPWCQHQQTRLLVVSRNGKHFCPQHEGVVVDLAKVVQAPKGDKAVRQSRKIIDRRFIGQWVVTPECVRQADGLFANTSRHVRRADRGKGPSDGSPSRQVPLYLDKPARRPEPAPAYGQKPAAGSWPCAWSDRPECRSDRSGSTRQLAGGKSHNTAPHVCIAAQTQGDGIRACNVGIAKYLPLAVIVVGQQRNRK